MSLSRLHTDEDSFESSLYSLLLHPSPTHDRRRIPKSVLVSNGEAEHCDEWYGATTRRFRTLLLRIGRILVQGTPRVPGSSITWQPRSSLCSIPTQLTISAKYRNHGWYLTVRQSTVTEWYGADTTIAVNQEVNRRWNVLLHVVWSLLREIDKISTFFREPPMLIFCVDVLSKNAHKVSLLPRRRKNSKFKNKSGMTGNFYTSFCAHFNLLHTILSYIIIFLSSSHNLHIIFLSSPYHLLITFHQNERDSLRRRNRTCFAQSIQQPLSTWMQRRRV